MEDSRRERKHGERRFDRKSSDRKFEGRFDSRNGGDNRRPMRSARFQVPSFASFDYKNIAFLQKFVTERGKVVSRRFSGISAKEQRSLAVAIKRARFLGLLPVGSARRK